jgi:ssDNA-binding Zn-finger/Zn-ribbon topoisomerase 1
MQTPDSLNCPDCGGPLVLKYSRRGTLLGCSRYPQCKYMRRLSSKEAKEVAGSPRLPAQDQKNDNGAH